MATATYAKLRSGDWGVRVEGTAYKGQLVFIRTKAGKNKMALIERVVWSGNGISLCAISPVSSSSTAATTTEAGGRCSECGGPIKDARHHKAMGGLCGSCAFDEYDC